MRAKITPSSVTVWLSASDTQDWADGYAPATCSRKGSTLEGLPVAVTFDASGMADFRIDGRMDDWDSAELGAIVADYLRSAIAPDHPLYMVTVGAIAA